MARLIGLISLIGLSPITPKARQSLCILKQTDTAALAGIRLHQAHSYKWNVD